MERKKKFKLDENEYEIEFPTVGQFIDIESEKVYMSNGQWGKMLSNNTAYSARVLQLINCFSILKVMCPDVIKDLKVNLSKIDSIDSVKIYRAFKKQIQPWWEEWFKEFDRAFIEDDEDTDDLKK